MRKALTREDLVPFSSKANVTLVEVRQDYVSINTYSLETELVNAGNGALLKGVYLKLHPKSETKWNAAVALNGDARAAAVQGLFDNTPKGDFAQLLAEAIREGDGFNVPPYLRTAIENVVQ